MTRRTGFEGTSCMLLLAACLGAARFTIADEPPVTRPAAAVQLPDDIAKKATILSDPRWRRMIFEFGAWLDGQRMYPPRQAMKIKTDFSRLVAHLSAADLEQLLGNLEPKLRVMDSPAAREARAAVGQYLSALVVPTSDGVSETAPDGADLPAEGTVRKSRTGRAGPQPLGRWPTVERIPACSPYRRRSGPPPVPDETATAIGLGVIGLGQGDDSVGPGIGTF